MKSRSYHFTPVLRRFFRRVHFNLLNYPFKKVLIRQLYHITPLLFILLVAISPYAFSDLSLIDFYRNLRREHETITSIMRFISWYGTKILLLTYVVILLVSIVRRNYGGRRFCIAFGALQYCCVMILLQLTKMAVGSPRPYTGEVEHHFFTLDSRYHSFPSGHTGEALGCSSTLTQISGSNAFAFCFGFVPALIAYSRVYLGKHHPIDLFAGMFYGSLTAFLVVYVLVNPDIWQRLPFKSFFNGASTGEEKKEVQERLVKGVPENVARSVRKQTLDGAPVCNASSQLRESRFTNTFLDKLAHANFEKI